MHFCTKQMEQTSISQSRYANFTPCKGLNRHHQIKWCSCRSGLCSRREKMRQSLSRNVCAEQRRDWMHHVGTFLHVRHLPVGGVSISPTHFEFHHTSQLVY